MRIKNDDVILNINHSFDTAQSLFSAVLRFQQDQNTNFQSFQQLISFILTFIITPPGAEVLMKIYLTSTIHAHINAKAPGLFSIEKLKASKSNHRSNLVNTRKQKHRRIYIQGFF